MTRIIVSIDGADGQGADVSADAWADLCRWARAHRPSDTAGLAVRMDGGPPMALWVTVADIRAYLDGDAAALFGSRS